MSDTRKGAISVDRFEGFGMISLRADHRDPTFKAAIEARLAPIPQTRQVTVGQRGMLAWMSPDELLAVVPRQEAASVTAALLIDLSSTHALVADVSDARAVFRLNGKGVREVLAKGAPVDLSKEAFGPGEVRRTRLGQVACAFWMSGEDQFDLICFRSVSDFVSDWLTTAARPGTLPHYL